MSRKPQSTVEERQIIINNFKNNKSIREIAQIVNKSKSTVFNIIKRFKATNSVENKKRNCTKRCKLSDRDKRFCLKLIENDPLLSAVDIKNKLKEVKDIDVSAETVRRVFRDNNLHGRSCRRKPLISEKNQRLRYAFAQKYCSMDSTFWSKVLFTDETKINLFGPDGKRFAWRKPRCEFNDKAIKKTVKYGGGSLMIWGCMSASGVGKIHFVNGIMDSKYYIDILKETVVESAENLGIKEDFVFYQDNDPKHKSLNARTWLLYNCPKVLETPPQSPDLNVIEHLWAELKKRVAKRRPKSIASLKEIVTEEWYSIEPEVCKKLVESIPRRLQAVIDNNGKSTKY